MSADHRAAAALALEHMAVTSDISSQMSYSGEATAHALLYVGDQLAQLVEQRKLANVIAAFGAVSEEPLIPDGRAGIEAESYVRVSIGDIVDLKPGGAQ